MSAFGVLADVCRGAERVRSAPKIRHRPVRRSRGHQCPLLALPQLKWLRKGSQVPSGTETARFNADPSRIQSGDRSASEIDVREWLGGIRQVLVTEEIVGLGRYGKTLTELSSPTIGDDNAGYDNEDDKDQMRERWTPRFHR
jgi:hypothetical protein